MAEFHSLRSETRNWDLGTDEKLLTKLDTFLNNMLNQCEVIQKNTDLAQYETNAVSVYLSDTFNALSNLSNKKFVENSMAPLEESTATMRETKKPKEITTEHKQENYQKAVANAVDIFNITNNDDDDLLSKSHTMSMTTMFRNTDNLPSIIGSKAFTQDEFIGIVDRTENVERYLRGLNKEALEDDGGFDFQPGQDFRQNGYMDPSMSSASSFLIPSGGNYSNNAASNKIGIEIRDTKLGPPPPLHLLLEQYNDRDRKPSTITVQRPGMNLMGEIANRGQARPNMMDEIVNRGQQKPNLMDEINNRGQARPNLMDEINNRGQARPNLMDEINNRGQARPNLMDEINNRGQARPNLMDEIANRGQPKPNLMDEIANQGRNKTVQETLNEQLAARNRGATGNVQQANMMSSQTMVDERSSSISSIRNNPLYQPIQAQATKQNKLFDEDEDDIEVGNQDLFKSTSNNKKKFENLLSNPVGGAISNPMLNPLNPSPFDPFGLSNPFMPFNPKGGVQSQPQQTEVTKRPNQTNPLVGLTDEPRSTTSGLQEAEKKEVKTNKLNKLFEDSDEDDETRLSKQRLLSQKYRADVKPKAEEKPVAAPQKAGNRVSKLFDDEDDDGGFLPSKKVETSQRKENTVAAKSSKKKLFDDVEDPIKEDDDDLRKSQNDKKKEDSLGLGLGQKNKTSGKNVRGSLFDNDDDDTPLGGNKKTIPSTSISKKKEKKTLFDEDDEEEEKAVQQPKSTKAPVIQANNTLATQNKKKTLFDADEEAVEQKQVVQEVKTVPKEVKPIVQEEPKREIVQPIKEEIKPKVEEIKPLAEVPKEFESESNADFQRPAAPANLTQLIKASQMNKRKKHGSSSEEDSGSDSGSDKPVPVKKAVPVVPTQVPAQQEAPKKLEVVEPPQEVIRYTEEIPKRLVDEEAPKQTFIQHQEQTKIDEPVQKTEEVPRHKTSETISDSARTQDEDNSRNSIQKQNVSSKISALQNMLNLNVDALKPSEGLPNHMRRPKASIQPEESSSKPNEESQPNEQNEQANTTETINTAPGGISHTAVLGKPIRQARAKKTIQFEDDEDEEIEDKTNKFVTSTRPIVEQTKPVVEAPKQEEGILRSSKIGLPNLNDDSPVRPSVSNIKKKVAFGEDDDIGNDPLGSSPKLNKNNFADPLGSGNNRPSTSSGADNPLNLLSGLKALDEKKSPKKSVGNYSNTDSYDNRPSLPKSNISSGVDNPLALLSGLKNLDAEQGRKSVKSRASKTKSLFEDEDDSMTKAKPRSTKSKGIFDDDDDGTFVPKSSGGPNIRDLQEPKTVETKQKESKRLTKLFDDSDDDVGTKKTEPIRKAQSKGKSKLFDDDD